MEKTSSKRFVAAIGNILDHYDTALFSLLAPFLAPLFFTACDPIKALLFTYCLLPIGLLSRPLGALFFGRMGDRYGHKKALSLSLSGVAITSFLAGCLPTYQTVGYLAPVLLGLIRMLQSFFSAGETTGGALFILERTPTRQRSLVSSLYDASTVSGFLLASFFVAIAAHYELVENIWRLFFWTGSSAALFGLFLRRDLSKIPTSQNPPPEPTLKLIRLHWKTLLLLSIASGFSYAIYNFAFTFMNGFVPLISTFTKAEVTALNTILLAFDMAMLPCFGLLAMYFGKERIMLAGLFGLTLFSTPLLALLPQTSLLGVALIRSLFVACGVAFSASFYAWALENTEPTARFTLIGLSVSIGSQLIGSFTASLSLWLYKQTGQVAMPGLYIAALAAVTIFVITRSAARKTATASH